MRRARPDTINTYIKNLQREQRRKRECDYKHIKARDSCLRLSVKAFFYFNDVHCAIEDSIPIVVPLLQKVDKIKLNYQLLLIYSCFRHYQNLPSPCSIDSW